MKGQNPFFHLKGRKNLNVPFIKWTCASQKRGAPAYVHVVLMFYFFMLAGGFGCAIYPLATFFSEEKGKNIYRRHCSIKPEWESCPWCVVESEASIHHLHLSFFLQKQSALYAETLNAKPVTHWENSVTARIYLPITRVCPRGSKR